jgi:hypothetical protein
LKTSRTIGAPYDDPNAPGVATGAAYIFTTGNGTFTTGHETARLTASDGTDGDAFGNAVSISDGMVVVGAPYAMHNDASVHGDVHRYVPSDGTNSETEYTPPSSRPGADYFGNAVAATPDAVAASGQNTQTKAGAIFVFNLNAH